MTPWTCEHMITHTQGLQVDRQMGKIGMKVVKSMLPPGTSMSNPYKWRGWAKVESTKEGKDKIKWKVTVLVCRARVCY